MNLIFDKPLESGAYFPVQQDWAGEVPAGWLEFPAKFLPAFYPADRQAAGFVTLTHAGQTVTDCIWNEDAYQAWLSALAAASPVPVTEDEFLRNEVTKRIPRAKARGIF